MSASRRRRAAALLVAMASAACGAPRSGVPAAELWSEHCANCHGADGRGVPARRALDPLVDLRRSRMMGAAERALVVQRIAYGYATMPGFTHKLPRGDIELLAEYAAELAGR